MKTEVSSNRNEDVLFLLTDHFCRFHTVSISDNDSVMFFLGGKGSETRNRCLIVFAYAILNIS